MAYSNLVVALARTLDVPLRYVRITQLPVNWEVGGRFFESSHMAVAVGTDASWDQAAIVDFGNVHTSAWRFSLYETVTDEEAFVLFQNNVAVQRLLAGDVAAPSASSASSRSAPRTCPRFPTTCPWCCCRPAGSERRWTCSWPRWSASPASARSTPTR